MISWIPLLGKEGLVNSALIGAGVIDEPLEVLLFSGLRGRDRLCAPADDLHGRADLQFAWRASTSGWWRRRSMPAPAGFDVMRYIIIPMSKSGIALGSIFVISIVMGDFFVVKVMSGGGSASVVSAFYEDVGVLQYPIAAASAVLLTLVLIAMIAADPARRRYPPGDHAMTVALGEADMRHDQNPAHLRGRARRPPSLDLLRARHRLHPLRRRALRPDDLHLHPVVPGYPRRAGVSDEGPLAALVRRSVHPGAHRRRQGIVRSLDQARGAGHGDHARGLAHGGTGVPPPLLRRHASCST